LLTPQWQSPSSFVPLSSCACAFSLCLCMHVKTATRAHTHTRTHQVFGPAAHHVALMPLGSQGKYPGRTCQHVSLHVSACARVCMRACTLMRWCSRTRAHMHTHIHHQYTHRHTHSLSLSRTLSSPPLFVPPLRAPFPVPSTPTPARAHRGPRASGADASTTRQEQLRAVHQRSSGRDFILVCLCRGEGLG